MNKTILRNYAKLIARRGINVQKGQEVIIEAELDQPEFVSMLTQECYRAGAGKVVVNWSYQPLQKLHVRHCSDRTLGNVEAWEEARMQHYVDALPCRIYLDSEDPDGLRGINQAKYAKALQSKQRVMKPYRDQMEDRYQWCIAAVPGVAWAKKLFPERSRRQAVEALWEAILTASRVDDDPLAAWDAHNDALHRRCEYLNNLQIRTLEYHSKTGTDLQVGLIEQGRFKGGSDASRSGIVFNANIPSEECYISPKKGQAEGIVYATKPLSYQGQLIDGFWLRFSEGKVVDLHAEQNEALLKTLVEMDEGAAYLGECALVPHDSPIEQIGLLFYNTLFDENAACHLALGRGFADTIRDFSSLTLEQCRALGINESMIHEDFMIGSAELDIDAVTANGRTVPIFRQGHWAF